VISRVLKTEAVLRITIAFAALNPLTAATLLELEPGLGLELEPGLGLGLGLGTAITTYAISSATRPTNRCPQRYSMTTAEIFNYAYAYDQVDYARAESNAVSNRRDTRVSKHRVGFTVTDGNWCDLVECLWLVPGE
jgi:hypothetical protein